MFSSFTHQVFEHKSHNLDPMVGNGVVFSLKGVSTHGKVIARTGQRIRVEVDGGATVWSEVKEVTAVKTAEHHSHHDLDASVEAAAEAAAAGKVNGKEGFGETREACVSSPHHSRRGVGLKGLGRPNSYHHDRGKWLVL
jgi:hypothetical protein